MFWILVWVLITFGIFGFAGWSYRILFQQKATWQAFAKRHKMEIVSGKTFEPVAVKGEIKGRNVQIYTVGDEDASTRTRITHTHVEMFVNTLPPAVIVAARRPLPTFMQGIEQTEPLSRGDDLWPHMGSASTDNAAAVWPWFTPRRTEALKRLMTMPQEAQTFFIADGAQCYLLWRSLDPLETPDKLNTVVKQMFIIAEQFDYDEEKAKATAAQSAKPKGVVGNAPRTAPERPALPEQTTVQSPDQTDDRHLPPLEEN